MDTVLSIEEFRGLMLLVVPFQGGGGIFFFLILELERKREEENIESVEGLMKITRKWKNSLSSRKLS